MNFLRALKGKKMYSIFTGTCPVCQEESMYREPNPYKVGKMFEMHTRCSNCDTKYKMEPSFFFGAMYVSYGLGIAFAIPVFLLAYFVLKLSLLISFFVIVAILFLLLPIIARWSRNIWINLFFDYKEKYTETNS